MNKHKQYLKIVEWSEDSQCYVGRVPGLALGGIHGKNEAKVFEKLVTLTNEWIKTHKNEGHNLPAATAGKKYSGRFNIRVGETLHEHLTIESLKVSESLNTYCVKVLKKGVNID